MSGAIASQSLGDEPLLRVEELKTHISLARGVVRAVDGVSFEVASGETLGIVGESGSGKSMTALSVLRVLPEKGGRIVGGRITLCGRDLIALSDRKMAREIRGREISLISQDPLTSLNPVFTIGEQVGAPLRYHGIVRGRRAVRERVVELLDQVGMPSPERRLGDYPHQFSGGMRQRVVAAMALACAPRLLIADEPTSNLDVTIQRQMLELFRELQREHGLGIVLITHDFGVAAACDRVAVMYAGRIVETAEVRALYQHPLHPYTRALLECVPRLGQRRRRLHALGGQPPSLIGPPQGCPFAPRCPDRMSICEQRYPPVLEPVDGHQVACWLWETKP